MSTNRGQVVKAMAVIRRPRDGAILVAEHTEPGRRFHRPLGGHVEFGEYAEAALHREFLEEIGQELKDLRLLGVIENIFEWQASRQHEVVFMFAASFADSSAYEIARQRVRDDPDEDTWVLWRQPGASGPPLYPHGTADLMLRA